MRIANVKTTVLAALLCGCMGLSLASCGSSAPDSQPAAETQQEAAQPATPADGTYDIDVDTDSSMFRSDSCTLTVEGGTCTAELVLPGEGFSRLYFGSAEDAASAADADIYDYRLNDEGKYTFDLPVSALDEELPIAAYGQRRDTWYDHTITFHMPA